MFSQGVYISFIGGCISFMILFNIFIKSFEYLIKEFAAIINSLDAKISVLQKEYAKNHWELINKEPDHSNLIMDNLDGIQSVGLNFQKQLANLKDKTLGYNHNCMIVYSLVVVLLALKTCLMPIEFLSTPLFDSVKHYWTSFSYLWIFSIILSVHLYYRTFIKIFKTYLLPEKFKFYQIYKPKVFISMSRLMFYNLIVLTPLALLIWILFFFQEFFFLNLYICYFTSLSISTYLIPKTEHKFAQTLFNFNFRGMVKTIGRSKKYDKSNKTFT